MAAWNSSINNTYCIYCHNNASSVFPFIDNANKSIANHSVNNPGTNPKCSSCHITGRIHNSTLIKPQFTLPNSTYCTSCHGSGGSATFKNISKHNNSVSTNCHQNTTFRSGARIIPSTLKHSSNSSNGSIWNITSTPYWTSQNGACYYCHNNTKHNSTAMGKISLLFMDNNNSRNGSLTTTTWCADCHYNDSNPNYRGNSTQWSPTSPLITINNTNKVSWVNHSSYLVNGYKDNTCKLCHSLNDTSYMATSLNYSHSLNEGVTGGKNCTSCHYIGSPFKQINVTSISLSIHSLMNNANASSAGVSAINGACWACHGDGKEPKDHPVQYKTPRTCKSCHVESGVTYNATSVKEEKHSMLENCRICHVVDTHKIICFNVVPGIKVISISKDKVNVGEKVTINATAVAGFNMRVKGAEFYIDSLDKTFAMSALDGSFDGQVEEIITEIDTSGLKPGTHFISVRAMELDNKWGVESSISFEVVDSASAVRESESDLRRSESGVIETESTEIETEGVPYMTIVLIGTFMILLWFVLKLVIKK